MKNEKRYPKIIAHRGVPNVLPGNTFESIHAASNLPIFGVEFDVDLTKDGVPIIFHQSTFPHNKEFNAIELGSRELDRRWTHDYEYKEINHFDIGSWSNKDHSNMRFTTLDSVLEIDWTSVQACVELKNPYFYTDQDSYPFGKRIVDVVKPILENFLNLGGSLQLIFFDPKTLSYARGCFPDVEMNLAIECFDPVDTKNTVSDAYNCGASGLIIVDKWLLSDSQWMTETKNNEMKLWAYELTPDKDQLGDELLTEEHMHEGWRKIFDSGVEGLHCDFPLECYKFFEKLSEVKLGGLVANS